MNSAILFAAFLATAVAIGFVDDGRRLNEMLISPSGIPTLSQVDVEITGPGNAAASGSIAILDGSGVVIGLAPAPALNADGLGAVNYPIVGDGSTTFQKFTVVFCQSTMSVSVGDNLHASAGVLDLSSCVAGAQDAWTLSNDGSGMYTVSVPGTQGTFTAANPPVSIWRDTAVGGELYYVIADGSFYTASGNFPSAACYDADPGAPTIGTANPMSFTACGDPDFVPLFGDANRHMFHVVLPDDHFFYELVSDCKVQMNTAIFNSYDKQGKYVNQWMQAVFVQANNSRVAVSHDGVVTLNGQQVLQESSDDLVRVSLTKTAATISIGTEMAFVVSWSPVAHSLVEKSDKVVGFEDVTSWNKLEIAVTKGARSWFSKDVSGLIGYSARFSNLDLVEKWFPGTPKDYQVESPFHRASTVSC